jgi:hypothetical protein
MLGWIGVASCPVGSNRAAMINFGHTERAATKAHPITDRAPGV